MLGQECLRFMSVLMAAGVLGGPGGKGPKFNKGIMEHNALQNCKVASRDKSLLRQWHQKFTAALGQVKGEYEEMVHKLVRQIDLGKELDNIISEL